MKPVIPWSESYCPLLLLKSNGFDIELTSLMISGTILISSEEGETEGSNCDFIKIAKYH